MRSIRNGIGRLGDKAGTTRRGRSASPRRAHFESLEERCVPAAFDLIGLTAARSDNRLIGIDGSGIGVVVIDTGVDASVPSLQPAILSQMDFTRGAGDPLTNVDEGNHGTQVAALIGARNPAIGVATASHLISLKVGGLNGSVELLPQAISQAYQWVFENREAYNIRVVNLSLSYGFFANPANATGILDGEAIDRLESAGITVVAAAGNDYDHYRQVGSSAPGVFSTLSVGAVYDADIGSQFASGQDGDYTTAPDRHAYFSNRPNTSKGIFAPGVNLPSIAAGNRAGVFTGASMATPIIAGVAALMQDAAQSFGGRYLTPSEIHDILIQSGDTIVDGDDEQTTVPTTNVNYSRVDVHQALLAVRELFPGATNGGGGGGGGGGNATYDGNSTLVLANDLGAPLDGSLFSQASVVANLSKDGDIAVDSRDVDMYKVTISTAGLLVVSTSAHGSAATTDTLLRLFDASGNQLAINDNVSPTDVTSRVFLNVSPGVYYVGVSGAGNTSYNPKLMLSGSAGATGDFGLKVALTTADPNGLLATATPITFYDHAFLRYEQIGTDGATYENGSPVGGTPVGSADVDIYTLEAPEDGFLTFDVDSTEMFAGAGLPADTFLRLFSPNGLELNTSNDTFAPDETLVAGNRTIGGDGHDGHTTDSYLRVAVVRGQRLYVGVSNSANSNYNVTNVSGRPTTGAQGYYSLVVRFESGETNGTLGQALAQAPVTPTTTGVNLSANLGKDGTQYVGEKDVDFYRIAAPTSGVLDVNLLATANGLSNVELAFYTLTGQRLSSSHGSGAGPGLQLAVTAGQELLLGVSGHGNFVIDPTLDSAGIDAEMGDYGLKLRLRPTTDALEVFSNEILALATPILVGSDWNASVGYDGGYWQGADDVDLYTFTAAESQQVTLKTSALFDTGASVRVRIFEANGQQITEAVDPSGATMLSFAVLAGQTYYIGVSSTTSLSSATYDPATLSNRLDGSTGRYRMTLDAIAPGALQDFTNVNDLFGAGHGPGGARLFFADAGAGASQIGVRVFDPRTGQNTASFSVANWAAWTQISDRTLFGDADGDGLDDLVQFNRPLRSGSALAGEAIRTIHSQTGAIRKIFRYDDFVPGQGNKRYRDLLDGLVDPEDAVFLGHFTQTNNLEVLFFNRTNQNAGSVSLRVFNLETGALTDEGIHNGINFGGWIDASDEYTVSDTNFDGLDDLVIINRVADPTPFRGTNIGFVGMVSLAGNAGGRQGSNIGFYRFFNWGFAKPGENSVFPGYDEMADRASFGRVTNNSAASAVILLVNSSAPSQAAFALLSPAPLVQGTPDSFQLISTQFHDDNNAGYFNPDDTFTMADLDGDKTDEVVAYSRRSQRIGSLAFRAFTGASVYPVPGGSAGAGMSQRPLTVPAIGNIAPLPLNQTYQHTTDVKSVAVDSTDLTPEAVDLALAWDEIDL